MRRAPDDRLPLERTRELQAQHERACIRGGRRHHGADGSALCGIGPPLGQDDGIDRLQRCRRIEPASLGQPGGGFGRAHQLADAVQHDVGEIGEGRVAGRRIAGRRQRPQEGGFIERVRRILDLVDRQPQRFAVVHARARLARLQGEPIGLLFHLLGASRQVRALGFGRIAAAAETVGDRRGEGARDAEMADHEGQHRDLGRVEELRQLGLDLVADEPQRAAGAQAFARLAQHPVEELHAVSRAQRRVEPGAIGNAPDGGAPDRLEQQIGAAHLEEAAMAVVVRRRPAQDLDGFLLADEGLQGLARLVPVDQEDQARAEMLEEGEKLLFRRDGMAAGHQVKDLLFHAARFLLGERAPLDLLVVEHRHEEAGAPAMDVGVGDGDGVVLDMDDDDMRVGLADVVLDGESPGRPRRRRAEAGMTERQRRRTFQAGHEGLDARPVDGGDVMDARTVDLLEGRFGGEGVDRLVRVHDQKMQAVGPVVTRRRHRLDVAPRQLVTLGLGQRIEERAPAPVQRGKGRRSGSLQGRQHAVDVAAQAGHQRVRPRNMQALAVQRLRAGDGRVELGIGQSRGMALRRQRIHGARRMRGVCGRLLQEREAKLQALVRGQGLGQERRQQQRLLAELLDDLQLLGHGSPLD